MKKGFAVTALAACILSAPAIAEDNETIDPSDLTRVYRQVITTISSDMDVRLAAQFTGAWNDNIAFAGFVEGVFGDDSDDDNLGTNYKRGRAQYFQAHKTSMTTLPRVGFSFDYVNFDSEGRRDANGKKMDNDELMSIGAVAALNPKYTGSFQIYPNLAYAKGTMMDTNVDGYQANLFVTRAIGDTGAFIQVWPEYFNVNGKDVDVEKLSFTLLSGVPLRQDRSLWFISKLTHENSSIKMAGNKLDTPANAIAEMGIRYYY